MSLHSKRIVVRRPVAFVGRRKVISPLGKVAKVEGHVQIGVHAVDTRGSRSFSLCRTAVSLLGRGDGIRAARDQLTIEAELFEHWRRSGDGRHLENLLSVE